MSKNISLIEAREISLKKLRENEEVRKNIKLSTFSLGDVINYADTDEVYKATFAENEHWYITKIAGCFYYCSENGEIDPSERPLPLTYSNLRAEYELI